MLRRFNHVAFRCTDAKETVDFYSKALGMPLAHAVTNDVVPSVKMFCPHLHLFFALDDGSYIAFFETPTMPPAQKDPNTPDWVQHIAFDVADNESLLKGKERLRAYGVEVIGPIDHGFANSIYFFDPNGHRLELTHWLEKEESDRQRYLREAPKLLQEWEERDRTSSCRERV